MFAKIIKGNRTQVQGHQSQQDVFANVFMIISGIADPVRGDKAGLGAGSGNFIIAHQA